MVLNTVPRRKQPHLHFDGNQTSEQDLRCKHEYLPCIGGYLDPTTPQNGEWEQNQESGLTCSLQESCSHICCPAVVPVKKFAIKEDINKKMPLV